MYKFPITIRAIWLDKEIGLKGYIQILLSSGDLVGLCSKEKFDLAPKDSIRTGWKNNMKIFSRNKKMWSSYPESQLIADGFFGKTKNIPKEILELSKSIKRTYVTKEKFQN
jgi:hypothetical protein